MRGDWLRCLLVCAAASCALAAYRIEDETPYLTNWPTLSDVYTVPIGDLAGVCDTGAKAPSPLTDVVISESMGSAQLQTACGTDKRCVIEAGVTITMNGNLNVAAIVNRVRTSASSLPCCF